MFQIFNAFALFTMKARSNYFRAFDFDHFPLNSKPTKNNNTSERHELDPFLSWTEVAHKKI